MCIWGKGITFPHAAPVCCMRLVLLQKPLLLFYHEMNELLVWSENRLHIISFVIWYHDFFFSFSFLFISDGIPNVRRVPLYSNVSVPCPGFTAEEMTFTLYRGDDKFASITYGNMSLIRSQENLGRILEHSVNSSDNTTNFILLNVTLNATGLYTCMAEKAYPPPLVKIPEQPQIIVIVEGVYGKLFFSLAFSQFIRNNNNNLR